MMHHVFNGKATLGLASLAGGISIGSVYIPKRVVEKGILAAGMIISAVSIFSGLIFTDLVIEYLQLPREKWDLPIAFMIGACSLSIINAVGNWFRQHEDDTITELKDDIISDKKE